MKSCVGRKLLGIEIKVGPHPQHMCKNICQLKSVCSTENILIVELGGIEARADKRLPPAQVDEYWG
jgi:hypothetical protein